MFLELRLNQSQGQGGPNQGNVITKPQQVGHRANVVLVTVRQHDGHHVVESIPDRLKVGQDQVNAGLGLLRKEHPAVDDQQLAINLKHGHVATDFTNSPERNNAQSSGK